MVRFSRDQCQEAGIISKRVLRKPRFLRKHAPLVMKSQDAMYQYFTDCRNGLQLDYFDTSFAESRPKWEGYLKRGLVYPRGFIVLDSSPNARKYDKERCALNVVEEKNLVKDLANLHVWEHAASVLMDDSYVTLVC